MNKLTFEENNLVDFSNIIPLLSNYSSDFNLEDNQMVTKEHFKDAKVRINKELLNKINNIFANVKFTYHSESLPTHYIELLEPFEDKDGSMVRSNLIYTYIFTIKIHDHNINKDISSYEFYGGLTQSGNYLVTSVLVLENIVREKFSYCLDLIKPLVNDKQLKVIEDVLLVFLSITLLDTTYEYTTFKEFTKEAIFRRFIVNVDTVTNSQTIEA